MVKYLFSLILSVSVIFSVTAQKTKGDTLVYYATNADDIVASKELADYVLIILPRKEENGKKLFPVLEYYTNGQRKLIATSSTNKFPLVMEGPYMRFFSNGKRQGSVMAEKGQPVGDELSYYPNGKFYSLRKHVKGKVLRIECRDSLGRVLAENGNGEWLEFDELFQTKLGKGPIKNGRREGEWLVADGKEFYKNGAFVNSTYDAIHPIQKPEARDPLPFEQLYLPKNGLPSFKEGMANLRQVIENNIHYPEADKKNNTEGQAYVGFFVEEDGTTSHFEVLTAPSEAMGNEALRLAKLLKNWNPAIKNDQPVSSPFILPVYFSNDTVASDTSRKTFVNVDESPEFDNGLTSFSAFLGRNIYYPETEQENNIQGKVLTTFIVEKDGTLSHIHISSTPSVGLAEESLRVLRLSPKWNPGTNGGKPVRVKYTMPINFTLGQQDRLALKEIKEGNATYVNAPSGKAYVHLEQSPEFPGGPAQFTKFLEKYISYPEIDRMNNTMGKVFISFIVESDGSLTNIESIRAPSKSLAKEGIRVLKLSPKWKAGMQDGKPVRVQYTVPINFTLGEE